MSPPGTFVPIAQHARREPRASRPRHRAAGDGPGAAAPWIGPGVADLLAEDPELAEGLDGERLRWARHAALAKVMTLELGPCEPSVVPAASCDGFGLLVLDGLAMRRYTIEHRSTAELLGPGDLLRPWDYDDGSPLSVENDLRILLRMRVAVLGEAWITRTARFPELATRIVARAVRRSRRLGEAMAVSTQPRLDLRVWMVLWELADRYGVVTRAGVELRLRLTHDVLGYLVAARRPSVSSALGRLAVRGAVTRTTSGWLLAGPPPEYVRCEPALASVNGVAGVV